MLLTTGLIAKNKKKGIIININLSGSGKLMRLSAFVLSVVMVFITLNLNYP